MKAVISSTYDDKYLFFLPIVSWCWNKLGVDVICFMPQIIPYLNENGEQDKANKHFTNVVGIMNLCKQMNARFEFFVAPKHKEATYAQCSRLYAAALDLPEDEIIITSDVDMALFKLPTYIQGITIFGSDLVPNGQYPMCYASGSVALWRNQMNINGRTYQQCLDDLLGHIEAEHFRGNYWGKDQETLFNEIREIAVLVNRARPGTQFASNRYDRDDTFVLQRLNPDTIDYHLPRPGYEENNFNQILTVLKYHYPNEDFQWLMNYREQYFKLINS